MAVCPCDGADTVGSQLFHTQMRRGGKHFGVKYGWSRVRIQTVVVVYDLIDRYYLSRAITKVAKPPVSNLYNNLSVKRV